MLRLRGFEGHLGAALKLKEASGGGFRYIGLL